MSSARAIMVQGTSSSAGKSLVCTALCRIFTRDGLRAYPFKSQNMALNSFVTRDGGEMGRAQAVQAEACGLEPHVNMNPVLLKPSSTSGSQVIVKGSVWGNFTAREYERLKPRLREIVRQAYSEVRTMADVVVIEGAGSPAEINLNEADFVNMGMARMAGCPVLLVGDIDRGGVFASLAGTVMLLDECDRARVKGIIVNKFRGDRAILEPGLRKLERIVGIPVLGVLPYMEIHIDDEDSVTEAFSRRGAPRDLRIGVVRLPYISNFSDFTPLEREPDVSLEYVNSPAGIAGLDLLIIPGSKNTIADLAYLRGSGLASAIERHHAAGGAVLGICGGFQMLGMEVRDPHGIEGGACVVEGLGLLPVSTEIAESKRTVQTTVRVLENRSALFSDCAGLELSGYEIHMGQTQYPVAGSTGGHLCREVCHPAAQRPADGAGDGWISEDGLVVGTYLHGIFENPSFTRRMLDSLRRRKGLQPLEDPAGDYSTFKSRQYDLLADEFRRHVDVEAIYRILEEYRDPA